MPGETLHNVELFASGEYRGKPYTPADIEEIFRNCHRLGPKGRGLLDPPAVRGHEEDSAAPERTDIPADGWVDPTSVRLDWKTNPRTRGRQRVILGTITDVPADMARLIRERRYRKLSAEIYDDFADDDGTRYGKALRRVAYLGGEVPQVKGLADLPMPQKFGESFVRLVPGIAVKTGSGTWVCHSEVYAMDRAQMIAAIQAAMPGLMPATLQDMSDDKLADLAKNLPTAPAPAAAAATPGVAAMADMTREDLIAVLQGMGEDPASLEGMTDEDLQALYDQYVNGSDSGNSASAMADGDPATMTHDELVAACTAAGMDCTGKTDDELRAMLAGQTAQPAATMADKSKALKCAEITRFAEQVARANLKQSLKTHTEIKRQDAEKFFEQLCRAGKAIHAQKSVVMGDLLKQDNITVRTFSEKGKALRTTAYEQKKRQYEQLPIIFRFGERVPSGDVIGGKEQQSAEVNKVEKFAEQFGHELRKAGSDPKAMVERAKKLAEKNPNFTAESLIGKQGAAMVA